MTLQLAIVLLLVLGSAVYFGRGFLLGLLGKGCGEEGGCANCSGGGCTLSKLEALRKDYEARKASR